MLDYIKILLKTSFLIWGAKVFMPFPHADQHSAQWAASPEVVM